MPEGFEPSNPWSLNAFDPPKPKDTPFKAPGLRLPHTHKQVPDERTLYTVQDNLTKAINALDDKDLKHAAFQVENAYRVLNRYLREWTQ